MNMNTNTIKFEKTLINKNNTQENNFAETVF